jgi:hypothetical protein
MRRHQIIWSVAFSFVSVVAVSGWTSAQTLDGFQADVLVERMIVDEKGTVHSIPPISYRWLRSTKQGKTTTTLVYQPSAQLVLKGATPDPYQGFRVEFDDDGSPLRIFDRQGRVLSNPNQAGTPALPPESTLLNPSGGLVVMRAGTIEDRARRLREAFGGSIGKLRGFDRYLSTQSDLTQEVLVSPTTALPIEINVTRNGVFESQSRFEYEQLADGSLVRRLWRSESVVPGRVSERFIVQMTVSNVVAGNDR